MDRLLKDWKNNVAFAIVLASIVGTIYYGFQNENKAFIQNGRVTVGITRGWNGEYIEYIYYVNDVKYTSKENPYFNKDVIPINGFYYLVYLPSNPSKSQILFHKKKPKDKSIENEGITPEDLSFFKLLGF